MCRHFGQEIIANKLGASIEDPKVMTLWLKLYKVRVVSTDTDVLIPTT